VVEIVSDLNIVLGGSVFLTGMMLVVFRFLGIFGFGGLVDWFVWGGGPRGSRAQIGNLYNAGG